MEVPATPVAVTQKMADPMRWWVLLSFCVQSFLQNFAFMNFSTDPLLLNEVLQLEGDLAGVELGFIYYGAYAATLPAMIGSMWLLLRGHDWTAGLIMAILIVIAAWLRLLAAVQTSYAWGLISTIVLGLAGGVIFTSFTFLPARWFPEEERAFATALAAQSCYAGWALGCFNVPFLGPEVLSNTTDPDSEKQHTIEGLKTFLIVQAIITTLILPLQLLTNMRGPLPTATGGASTSTTTGGSGARPPPFCQSVTHSLYLLRGKRQYIIHSICYAVLGAIGYGVPGVAVGSFESHLGELSDVAWILDGLFVVSGVLTGLLCGKLVPLKYYGLAVKGLFAVGTGALLIIQVMVVVSDVVATFPPAGLYALLVVLMCLAGAGTLGFINLGLRFAVAASEPVEEIYAGAIIEFGLLATACVLGLLTYTDPTGEYTFTFFAVPAAIVTPCLFLFAKFEMEPESGQSPREAALLHDSGVVAVVE